MSREGTGHHETLTDVTGLVSDTPSGTVGFDMTLFPGARKSQEWLLTLTLVGGAWGSAGPLDDGSALATGKTYHFLIQHLGLFDRVKPVCVSGPTTTWTAVLTEVLDTSTSRDD